MWRKILLATVYGGFLLALFGWGLFQFLKPTAPEIQKAGPSQPWPSTGNIPIIQTQEEKNDLFILTENNQIFPVTKTQELEEKEADISQDGQKIAIIGQEQNEFQLWLWSTETSGLELITFSANSLYTPRLSPNGKKILYVEDVHNSYQLYIVDLATKETFRLANDVIEINWGAHDRQIFFSRGEPEPNIFLLTFDQHGQPEPAQKILENRSSFVVDRQEIYSLKKATTWQLVKTTTRSQQEKILANLGLNPTDHKARNLQKINDQTFLFNKESLSDTNVHETWLINQDAQAPIILRHNLTSVQKKSETEIIGEQTAGKQTKLIVLNIHTQQPTFQIENAALARKHLRNKDLPTTK